MDEHLAGIGRNAYERFGLLEEIGTQQRRVEIRAAGEVFNEENGGAHSAALR
jgi:hypothetical protein